MSDENRSVWTIADVLSAADTFLHKYGSLSPRLEAERLMADALKMDRVDLYLQFDRPLDVFERDIYKEKIKARARGVPLQYITGEQGFRKLNLKVSPDVLIPRPETELLVEFVIKKLDQLKESDGDKKNGDPVTNRSILDIGTGSGAISISLAYEVEDVSIWALDRSKKALAVAKENAGNYQLLDRITFFESDLFSGVDRVKSGKFDIIIANPPYIASQKLKSLPKDVKFEPIEALDGGPDGLTFFQSISKLAKDFLRTNGLLVFEIGDDQACDVSRILETENYRDTEVIKDYSDRDRIIAAIYR